MYNKIQLIAYHTPTLLGSSTKKPAPIVPPPKPIKALSNNDEKYRVFRMYQVLLWAATDPAVDTSQNTLKVFMAPEFYFKTPGPSSKEGKRGAGAFGAYSFNTMINMLECLRTIFTTPITGAKADLLKHWLIIPGTIVSDLPGGGKSYSAIAAENVYMNTAVVIKGEKGGLFHYIHKYFISDIDGPPIEKSISKTDPYKNVLQKLKQKGYDEFDSYHFSIDKLSFALDICLDHAKGHAKKYSKQKVDVHIVTSCGMKLIDNSIVAKANGHAMICDGSPNNSFPRSDVRKFNGAKLGASKWRCDEKSGAPKISVPNAIAEHKPIPVDLRIGAFDSVDFFKKGESIGKVEKKDVSGLMFPEEIIWYKAVRA